MFRDQANNSNICESERALNEHGETVVKVLDAFNRHLSVTVM